jgi:hypothetical protein
LARFAPRPPSTLASRALWSERGPVGLEPGLVRADVARLLDGPPMDPLGAKFQRMREAIEREAGRQAVESSVVVGEKAGDYSS